MDNMIRGAAEQHHPAYDNKAWDKMEQLLDKHLPQKKDRRGFIFFLLLGLLIAGGLFVGGYYFYGNKKEKTASVDTKKEDQKLAVTPGKTSTPNDASIAEQNASSSVEIKDNISTANDAEQNRSNNTNGSEQKNSNKTTNGSEQVHANTFTVKKSAAKTNININPGSASEDEVAVAKVSPGTKKNLQDKGSFNDGITKIVGDNADKQNTPGVKENIVENKPDVQPGQKKTTETDIVKEVAKETVVEPASDKKTASTEKKKSKHSIAGNFGLTVSAGPDISYVELNKPGKVTLSYGVGLSYTFIKKLTLQAGFYISKKLYSADSADYNAPAAFWNAYPNMSNTVAANCKVYEVPVKLLYNFGKKGHHNWVAGAGISTYFMKKETYDYSYSYSGIVYPKSYSIENKNQHNLSVLTLTGGYQYNLSPRVSFSAEPYVKVPLTGVGFGKVKLKGGGVLVNLTVKPFAKKNKK